MVNPLRSGRGTGMAAIRTNRRLKPTRFRLHAR
jgi:hypothetical protein